jgi:hypothetical protein
VGKDPRQKLAVAIVVATALGIGSLVLQRWVAETRGAAIALVVAWYGLVGIAALAYTRPRPWARLPALGTVAAIAVVTVAVGYWTGFRDDEVDEEVAVAGSQAAGAEREAALLGGEPDRREKQKPSGPVELASGSFSGEDGHAGSGTATIVEEPDGDRQLTFTRFDVDPGAAVEVYLTPDTGDVADRVELGELKGNVGDQQYEVPPGADLRRYDSVVLWCTPFTVRIAVAELS